MVIAETDLDEVMFPALGNLIGDLRRQVLERAAGHASFVDPFRGGLEVGVEHGLTVFTVGALDRCGVFGIHLTLSLD